jgi:hypothetical protein
MTNTNCLEGIRCPSCGHEDDFRIEARIMIFVADNGTDDESGQYAWDGESPCWFAGCAHEGKIKYFENQKPTGGLPDSIEIS